MNLNFVMPQSNTPQLSALSLLPTILALVDRNTEPVNTFRIWRSLHALIYIFVPGVFYPRGYIGLRGLHSFLPRGTRSQNWTLRHQVISSPLLAETVEDFLSTIEPCAIRWFFGSNFKDFPPGVDLTRHMSTLKAGLCFADSLKL